METKIFSKKLTQTDVRNRLSVRTRSLHFFPPFEDGQNAQDLMVEDEQGKPWPFRLVVRSRGRYKKPVLTAGWREFVTKKELQIGFKVEFFRENNEVTGEVKGGLWWDWAAIRMRNRGGTKGTMSRDVGGRVGSIVVKGCAMRVRLSGRDGRHGGWRVMVAISFFFFF
ncbi:hypothetical protein Pint_19379 [Pistacia integerrima]|uniref:Uncharacterized protein n=1 Tax=Pistacia integerrima TaxID=434235 RepID=A0ACC0YYX9_9ROSI|nr:hypothetical protein Pint_19379 [Pistacia integerrima]